jgi:hypothetical protein
MMNWTWQLEGPGGILTVPVVPTAGRAANLTGGGRAIHGGALITAAPIPTRVHIHDRTLNPILVPIHIGKWDVDGGGRKAVYSQSRARP